MWSTEVSRRQKAEGRRQPRGARRPLRAAVVSRRLAYCLLLSAFCLLSFGCRMDMQDQPKYKTFRAGDGMVVRRGYRQPPSYYDDRLQEGTTPAAHFFDVIANGWGAMPSYAEQIPAEDRWKIIAYIRALQLSRRLKMDDLSPEDQQKVLRGAQARAGVETGGQ